jgi:hypothetical protein
MDKKAGAEVSAMRSPCISQVVFSVDFRRK